MGHGLAAFLDASAIRRSAGEAELGAIATESLVELARRIQASSALTDAVSALHHAVYESEDDSGEAARVADAALGDEAGVLHALFVLESLRLVRERQGARGIPPEISAAVNARHGVAWLARGLAPGGRVAIADWPRRWFRLVATGRLYRLGRLEFYLEPWDSPFRAYVRPRTGETLVLAEAGLCFDRDGYLGGRAAFETTLSEGNGEVLGFAISPRGFCLPEPTRLSLSDWELELAPGAPVLDLHVPTEGALTLDALGEALALAEPFFDRHHPESSFRAFVCSSWLFSPELERLLPSGSNILAWQRQGYLLPEHGGHESFLEFTFGSRQVDPRTAPRDTRLRRAVLEHLEGGGRLRAGAWLLLRRDRARFGAEPYLTTRRRATM